MHAMLAVTHMQHLCAALDFAAAQCLLYDDIIVGKRKRELDGSDIDYIDYIKTDSFDEKLCRRKNIA